MKIFLNIEADSPAELDDAIRGLASAIGAVTGVTANIPEQKTTATVAETVTPPKKAAAKKAAPVIEGTANKPAPTEPPAIAADEVKGLIIDLLNDWTEAAPTDAEIRVKVLKPLLASLGGAEKIKEIDPTLFPQVAGLVDESRAALEAFKAASAPTEE